MRDNIVFMKKSLFVILFGITIFSLAGNADLFQVNEEKIEKEFAELTLLEQKIEKGEDVSMMMNLIEFEQIIDAPTKSQDYDGLEILACCFSDIAYDACVLGLYWLEDLYEWIFYRTKAVKPEENHDNGPRDKY